MLYREVSMKEKIYAVVILLCGILMVGTEGAVLCENIGIGQGCLQIGASVVVGLFFYYLIWLEETRAARRRK